MKRITLLLCALMATLGLWAHSTSFAQLGISPSGSPQRNAQLLQRAIDSLSALGGSIFVDPVADGYPLDGGLVLRRNVSLIGVHGPTGRGTSGANRQSPVGSLFVVRDRERPFIIVESATQIRGLQFWYPDQPHDSPQHIIAYPPTIQMSHTQPVQGVTLSCLTFYGEYFAMDFCAPQGGASEQILVEHCYGYPLGGQFVAIDRCYDIPRILHCHVNPSNARLFGRTFSPRTVDAVVARGKFAYWIERTDNAQLIDVFTFGSYGGIYLGTHTYGQLTNFNLDCVTIGIHKLGEHNKNRNWQISQGSIIANVAPGGDATAVHPIVVEGQGHTALANVEAFSGGNPALTNCGASHDFILVRGEGNLTVSMTGCRMQGYTAPNPITILNPNARLRAVACVDGKGNFFDK